MNAVFCRKWHIIFVSYCFILRFSRGVCVWGGVPAFLGRPGLDHRRNHFLQLFAFCGTVNDTYAQDIRQLYTITVFTVDLNIFCFITINPAYKLKI